MCVFLGSLFLDSSFICLKILELVIHTHCRFNCKCVNYCGIFGRQRSREDQEESFISVGVLQVGVCGSQLASEVL